MRRSLPWIRLYTDLVNDPKVQTLTDEGFKFLINVWCLAGQNDGLIPPARELAWKLRLSEADAVRLLDALSAANLLDQTVDGFMPHNWEKRQFISDYVSERVRKSRAKKKGNVSCNNGNVTRNVAAYVSDYVPRNVSETLENRAEQNQSRIRTEQNLPSLQEPGNGLRRITAEDFRKIAPDRFKDTTRV